MCGAEYGQASPERVNSRDGYVHDHLDAARADVLAFTAFPKEIWRQIWSNNPNERLNREIRRRTDVVGIFLTATPSPAWSAPSWAEQHDEWAEGRRYLGLEVLARARLTVRAQPSEPATDTSAGLPELDPAA